MTRGPADRRRHPGRWLAAGAAIALAGAVAGYMLARPGAIDTAHAAHTVQPPATTPPPSQRGAKAAAPESTDGAGSPRALVSRYCTGHPDARTTRRLARAGGLVAIFENRAAPADPYACARAYLAHGGPINKADPRPDHGHWTPLLYAVRRNDPNLVRFLLAHGADPRLAGGPRHLEPYGYAIYVALHDPKHDHNTVLGLINHALGAHGN